MKKLTYLFSTVLLLSCNSSTYEEISDHTPAPEIVTYAANVKPIVDENCISCHSQGGPAAFRPLTEYNQVREYIDIIINRIEKQNGDPQKMPVGGTLSSSQIDIFIQWKADGFIEN